MHQTSLHHCASLHRCVAASPHETTGASLLRQEAKGGAEYVRRDSPGPRGMRTVTPPQSTPPPSPVQMIQRRLRTWGMQGMVAGGVRHHVLHAGGVRQPQQGGARCALLSWAFLKSFGPFVQGTPLRTPTKFQAVSPTPDHHLSRSPPLWTQEKTEELTGQH